MRCWVRLALLASVLIPGLGCAAIHNVAAPHGEKKVYGGTRGELEAFEILAYGPNEKDPLPDFSRTLSVLALFDLPFTFIVDTLTLPITIPVSISRHSNPPPPSDPPSPGVEAQKGYRPSATPP